MKAARRVAARVTAAAIGAAAVDAAAAADASADLAMCMDEAEPDLDLELLDALVEHDPVDDIKSLVIADPAVGWFVCVARHLRERDRFAIFEHVRFSAPRAGPASPASAGSASASPLFAAQGPTNERESERERESESEEPARGLDMDETAAAGLRHDAARRRLRGGDPGAMSASVAPGYLRAADVGATRSAAHVPVRWGYAVAHADHGAIRACFWWHNADGSVREIVTNDPLEAIKDEILLRVRMALAERCD